MKKKHTHISPFKDNINKKQKTTNKASIKAYSLVAITPKNINTVTIAEIVSFTLRPSF
jgi:hypothetical protein